jgi:hypothetical protein
MSGLRFDFSAIARNERHNLLLMHTHRHDLHVQLRLYWCAIL